MSARAFRLPVLFLLIGALLACGSSEEPAGRAADPAASSSPAPEPAPAAPQAAAPAPAKPRAEVPAQYGEWPTEPRSLALKVLTDERMPPEARVFTLDRMYTENQPFATEIWILALDDSEPEVVLRAVKYLKERGGEEGATALAKLADHPDPRVRAEIE